MCTEPENPNLPHWRRPKEEPLKGVKTEPLIGEAREAALRAQAVADAAFKEGQLHEFTGTEGDDWGVYDSYWHKVGDELCGTGLSTFVSAHDVTEEVRRRLAVDQ